MVKRNTVVRAKTLGLRASKEEVQMVEDLKKKTGIRDTSSVLSAALKEKWEREIPQKR